MFIDGAVLIHGKNCTTPHLSTSTSTSSFLSVRTHLDEAGRQANLFPQKASFYLPAQLFRWMDGMKHAHTCTSIRLAFLLLLLLLLLDRFDRNRNATLFTHTHMPYLFNTPYPPFPSTPYPSANPPIHPSTHHPTSLTYIYTYPPSQNHARGFK